MDHWTIIRIELPDGSFRFDAMQVNEPIDPAVGLEFEDGERIAPGSFSIVTTGYTESQVDQFYAAIEDIHENP